MGKKFIIDRIEGESIVLENENGERIVIDKASVKIDTTKPKEGDVLILRDNSFIIDKQQTIRRKKEMGALMKGMWE